MSSKVKAGGVNVAYMPTLADRLREAREHTGMNKRQFALAIGAEPATVTQWENGKTASISAALIIAVQRVTGFSAEWLVTGKGDKFASQVTTDQRALLDAAAELDSYDLAIRLLRALKEPS